MSYAPSHPLLTAIEQAAPKLQPMVSDIEPNRCLTDPMVDMLRETGVFRMAVPAEYGGWQADPFVQLRAVELLSEVDASLGWYTMIGSDGGFYCSFLEPEVAKRLYGPDPDVVTAGFVDPAGVARPNEDGYLISGRWPFGSASQHSTYLASGCRVEHDAGGRSPAPIVAMLSTADCTLHDTWHSMGLRGSGSFDYSTTGQQIAAELTFSFADPPRRTEPLYRFPMMYRANVPGVALGVAGGALREFMTWIGERRDSSTGRERREGPVVQRAAGMAEAQIASARAYAVDVLGELWDTLLAGDDPGLELRARYGLMIAHTGIECREAVQKLYSACGGSAVYDKHPLQQRIRDAITISQHVLHDERTYLTAGGALLGLPIDRASS
jgi:alkylation response protein AidB-like acyl-CoA dehydrogenase